MSESAQPNSIAIKSTDDWVLDINGLPLGTDKQGQTFTADTNVDLSPGDRIPLYYYHGFAEKAASTVERIGEAVYQGLVNGAHKFKGMLDQSKERAQSIWADAKAGKAIPVSSDSSAHLVRPMAVLGKPGTVTNWPIFALSLLSADQAGMQINPRAVAFAAAKAYMSEIEESDAVSGEAAKAGEIFARRNRKRIAEIKSLVDEMYAEFPMEGEPATVAAQTNTTIENQPLPVKADVLALPDDELKALITTMVRAALTAQGIVK